MRTMARLGFSVEDADVEKSLNEFASDALQRKAPTWPMLTVLDEACNACVRTHFMVTNACQGCLARPCMMNCGKKAIEIKNGRAHIDEEKCVNCGLCMQNCPYHAIIKIPVPCEEACPVGAISKDENGKERIDYDKCIFCGNCMASVIFTCGSFTSIPVRSVTETFGNTSYVTANLRSSPTLSSGTLSITGCA